MAAANSGSVGRGRSFVKVVTNGSRLATDCIHYLTKETITIIPKPRIILNTNT